MPTRAVAPASTHNIQGWDRAWIVNLENSSTRLQLLLGSTMAGSGGIPGLVSAGAGEWVQVRLHRVVAIVN